MTDPIGDMIARIKNGYIASLKEVKVPYSKIKENLAKTLLNQRYLKEVAVEEEEKGKKIISLTLGYKSKKPLITEIKRISKPGRRKYLRASKITRPIVGLGTMILSTSLGILDGREARKKNLGGEIICHVW